MVIIKQFNISLELASQVCELTKALQFILCVIEDVNNWVITKTSLCLIAEPAKIYRMICSALTPVYSEARYLKGLRLWANTWREKYRLKSCWLSRVYYMAAKMRSRQIRQSMQHTLDQGPIYYYLWLIIRIWWKVLFAPSFTVLIWLDRNFAKNAAAESANLWPDHNISFVITAKDNWISIARSVIDPSLGYILGHGFSSCFFDFRFWWLK